MVILIKLKTDAKRFFKGKKFVPELLAEELIKENIYITRPQDGKIFCYDPNLGIHNKNSEWILRKEIFRKLDIYSCIRYDNQTVSCLKNLTMKDLPLSPYGLIAVQNGILNIFTGELKPFSPDYFILNAFKVNYDKTAKYSDFTRALNEVLPKLTDQLVIQEFFGYCLFQDCRYKKALMLHGSDSTRKSTIIHFVLRKLLGRDNYSILTLDRRSYNKEWDYLLFGSLANFSLYNYTLSSSILKGKGIFETMLSGGKLTAREKFKKSFEFNNVAKLIFECAMLPDKKYCTNEFLQHWLIVDFPKNNFSIEDTAYDIDTEKKLTTSEGLSGILNWSLDGVQRLVAQKGFTAN